MGIVVLLQFVLIINMVLVNSSFLPDQRPKIKSKDFGQRGDYAIEVTVIRNVPTKLVYDEKIIDSYNFEEGTSLMLNCHRNNKNFLKWTLNMKIWASPIESKRVLDTNYVIQIMNISRYYDGLQANCSTNDYNSPRTLNLKMYNGQSKKQPPTELVEFKAGDKVSLPCGEKNGGKGIYNQLTRYSVEYTNSSTFKSSQISRNIFDRIDMKDNGTKIMCAELKNLGLKGYRRDGGIKTNKETLQLEVKRQIIIVQPNTRENNDNYIEHKEQQLDNEIYSTGPVHPFILIGGISSFIVLIIILFVIYKCINISREKQKLDSHIYAEPSQVVYAQIQVDSTSSSNSPPFSNEVPYAKIIGYLTPKNHRKSEVPLPPRNKKSASSEGDSYK